MSQHKSFRAALTEDMARLGLSEASLGRRMGISQQAVHKWVERNFPPLGRLDELLQILGKDNEVSKLPREVSYGARQRTVLTAAKPMPLGYTNGAVLAQDTHRHHRDVLKAQLPAALHGNMQVPIPDGGNTELRVDFANDKVVVETVTIVGANASRNIASAILQLLLYRTKVPTIERCVLVVMCEDVNRPLPRLAEESASNMNIEILHVHDGDEAARAVAAILGVNVTVELYEPEE